MSTAAQAEKEILIIEDDQAISQMLEMALEIEGYHVVLAATAECALNLLIPAASARQSHKATQQIAHPDLILLDLQLPRIKGDDLIKQLALTGQPVPPVIVLSAKRKLEVETAAREIGAVETVLKPFDVDKLLLTIDRVISSPTQPPQKPRFQSL